MIGKQVKNLLGDFKLTAKINPETFNGISKYYKNIKAEYNRMIKLGESAKIHSKHNPVKSGQDTEHPRREALLKSSSPTRLELLQLSDTELDTWFNENVLVVIKIYLLDYLAMISSVISSLVKYILKYTKRIIH